MHICFVNTQTRWAGGERWFLWAASAMAKLGHETVLTAGEDSVLGQRASGAGIGVETTGASLVMSLRKIFRHRSPDIVLCNSGGEARSAVLARWRGGSPKVALRRGLCRDLGKGPMKASFYKKVDGFFCNSRKTADLLKDAHPWLTGLDVEVLYNPVPQLDPPDAGEVKRLREELSLTPHTFTVLSVGRLDEDKGHVFLVRGFRDVLEEVPGARLLIAGEGPEREALEAVVNELGLGDAVRLCGFVSNPANLYRVSDVLVMPSLPGYESFSNAALEALSFAIPVVATTCGGFPELIVHGKSGMLVEPGNAAGIADALTKLGKDDRLRNGMGGAGKAMVDRDFQPDRKAAELEAYLEGILKA